MKTAGSPWFAIAGLGCVLIGLLGLGVAIALRWLVVYGRPMVVQRMLDVVSWNGSEQVLDVGCGPGFSLVKIAKRLTSGNVIGLDKWMVIHGERKNSKAITLENAQIEGVLNLVAVQDGDASAMPFVDESFDVVVSSFVFHHMTKDVQQRALREIARVTKPGGQILIADEGAQNLASFLSEFGITNISTKRLVFSVHLLNARKMDSRKKAD